MRFTLPPDDEEAPSEENKEPDRYAVLDESGEAIPATLLEWAQFLKGRGQRVIQQDEPFGFFVSTVFIGLNYSSNPARPLWFETMIFNRWKGEYLSLIDRPRFETIYERRYTTLKEAILGHAAALDWLKAQSFYYPLALPNPFLKGNEMV
jgi:hypothetical protein